MFQSRHFFIVVLLTLAHFYAQSQRNVRDSTVFSPHISFSYAYQLPIGDMAERFGENSNIGFTFGIKSKKNWYYGLNTSFFFGKEVTEDGLLQNLLTDGGEIIDNTGMISQIIISERGYTISAEGGKIFNIIGPNPNCGLMIKGGVGFLQHKIRIEHQRSEITQLEDEYLKGYDRLTNGIMFSEFVGYYHMSNNRLSNFYIGVEAIQAITEGRRDLNFDTLTSDSGVQRFDGLVGIRLGWILNFYHQSTNTFYFN